MHHCLCFLCCARGIHAWRAGPGVTVIAVVRLSWIAQCCRLAEYTRAQGTSLLPVLAANCMPGGSENYCLIAKVPGLQNSARASVTRDGQESYLQLEHIECSGIF